MGDFLYAHLSNSFKDNEKNFGKLNLKQLKKFLKILEKINTSSCFW